MAGALLAGTETRLPFLTALRQQPASVAHMIPFNVLNDSFELKSSLSPTLHDTLNLKTPTKSEFSRKTHTFENAL